MGAFCSTETWCSVRDGENDHEVMISSSRTSQIISQIKEQKSISVFIQNSSLEENTKDPKTTGQCTANSEIQYSLLSQESKGLPSKSDSFYDELLMLQDIEKSIEKKSFEFLNPRTKEIKNASFTFLTPKTREILQKEGRYSLKIGKDFNYPTHLVAIYYDAEKAYYKGEHENGKRQGFGYQVSFNP